MSDRGLVVFTIDWDENHELHPDHPDNVTVRDAVETSWIYSAAEGDWIKRVRHCLHLAGAAVLDRRHARVYGAR